MRIPWPFRRPALRPLPAAPPPDVPALLRALRATPPDAALDLGPLAAALSAGPVPRDQATAGLLDVLAWTLEPRFRLPELPALLLAAGADPNARFPFASSPLDTALRCAVHRGLVSEDTAPIWDRAGADWASAPEGLLPLVFTFRPLDLSDQARSLVALSPYVPATHWSRPLASGRTPREEWERLKNTWTLDSAVRARMDALDGEAGRAERLRVDLERTLPPLPPAPAAPRPRPRL